MQRWVVRRVSVIALLALCACAPGGSSRTLEVEAARIEPGPQPALVVDLDFAPRAQVLEALDRGVAIRLEFDLGGHDENNYVVFERHSVVLTYQPLVLQWQLERSGESSPRLFSSRSELMAAIDQVRLPLRRDWLQLRGRRDYSLRVRLRQASLPGPLRLPAWFSRAWRIDSGEVSWTTAA